MGQGVMFSISGKCIDRDGWEKLREENGIPATQNLSGDWESADSWFPRGRDIYAKGADGIAQRILSHFEEGSSLWLWGDLPEDDGCGMMWERFQGEVVRLLPP